MAEGLTPELLHKERERLRAAMGGLSALVKRRPPVGVAAPAPRPDWSAFAAEPHDPIDPPTPPRLVAVHGKPPTNDQAKPVWEADSLLNAVTPPGRVVVPKRAIHALAQVRNEYKPPAAPEVARQLAEEKTAPEMLAPDDFFAQFDAPESPRPAPKPLVAPAALPEAESSKKLDSVDQVLSQFHWE